MTTLALSAATFAYTAWVTVTPTDPVQDLPRVFRIGALTVATLAAWVLL